MKYDEFKEKLAEYKRQFKAARGKEMETVSELESFLEGKKFRGEGSRTLRSLKGFDV